MSADLLDAYLAGERMILAAIEKARAPRQVLIQQAGDEPKERTVKCEEGCNEAVYQLWNGDEVQTLCEPAFAQSVVDLVAHNEKVIFYHDGVTNDGLKVIRLG